MANTMQHQHIKWFGLIRILGLLMILGYHFFTVGYPGGFIGVDLFFVFSGFLITSLMIDEFSSTHQFDLVAFLRRRFYRIVPAVVMMILVVVPFTLLVSPDVITGLDRQIAAALGFVTNWYELATGGSYTNNFIPHLFVHTWFLGVEMQFYLFWGVLVWGISRLLKNPEVPMRERRVRFRGILFALALLFTGVSLLLMWRAARGLKDFTPVYFSSLTHAFPLFAGALLATVTGVTVVPMWFRRLANRTHRWISTLTLMLAAAATVWLGTAVHFNAASTYPAALMAATVLAMIMILAARLLHESTSAVQEPKFTTVLAGLSYGIYLYHWPLLVIFDRLMRPGTAIAVTLVLSIGFAALSVYVVEPLVAGKVRLTQHKVALTGVCVIGACLALVTGRQVQTAPALSQLDTTLWTEGLQQDIAQYQRAAPEIIAAHTPRQTAETDRLAQANRAAAQAAKAAPHGYQAQNRHSTAAAHHIPAGVSIIGDSVTLGTASYLSAHVANVLVNAEGDRTMNQAVSLVRQQQSAGTLREFVVIACGTNSLNNYATVLQQLLDTIGPGHKLVLVTPYNGKAQPDWNSSKLTALERSLPASHDWVTLADWTTAAASHPEVFKGTDGVHFGGHQDGNVLFAQTINEALIAAAQKPAKK